MFCVQLLAAIYLHNEFYIPEIWTFCLHLRCVCTLCLLCACTAMSAAVFKISITCREQASCALWHIGFLWTGLEYGLETSISFYCVLLCVPVKHNLSRPMHAMMI